MKAQTISQFLKMVKSQVERSFSQVFIQGEVSNLSLAAYLFLSIGDGNGSGQASSLRQDDDVW